MAERTDIPQVQEEVPVVKTETGERFFLPPGSEIPAGYALDREAPEPGPKGNPYHGTAVPAEVYLGTAQRPPGPGAISAAGGGEFLTPTQQAVRGAPGSIIGEVAGGAAGAFGGAAIAGPVGVVPGIAIGRSVGASLGELGNQLMPSSWTGRQRISWADVGLAGVFGGLSSVPDVARWLRGPVHADTLARLLATPIESAGPAPVRPGMPARVGALRDLPPRPTRALSEPPVPGLPPQEIRPPVSQPFVPPAGAQPPWGVAQRGQFRTVIETIAPVLEIPAAYAALAKAGEGQMVNIGPLREAVEHLEDKLRLSKLPDERLLAKIAKLKQMGAPSEPAGANFVPFEVFHATLQSLGEAIREAARTAEAGGLRKLYRGMWDSLRDSPGLPDDVRTRLSTASNLVKRAEAAKILNKAMRAALVQGATEKGLDPKRMLVAVDDRIEDISVRLGEHETTQVRQLIEGFAKDQEDEIIEKARHAHSLQAAQEQAEYQIKVSRRQQELERRQKVLERQERETTKDQELAKARGLHRLEVERRKKVHAGKVEARRVEVERLNAEYLDQQTKYSEQLRGIKERRQELQRQIAMERDKEIRSAATRRQTGRAVGRQLAFAAGAGAVGYGVGQQYGGVGIFTGPLAALLADRMGDVLTSPRARAMLQTVQNNAETMRINRLAIGLKQGARAYGSAVGGELPPLAPATLYRPPRG